MTPALARKARDEYRPVRGDSAWYPNSGSHAVSRSVLILDDDDDLRMTLAETLEAMCGVQPVMVSGRRRDD